MRNSKSKGFKVPKEACPCRRMVIWENEIKWNMMKTILSIILFLGVWDMYCREGFKIVRQLGGSLGGKLVLAVSGEQGFVKLEKPRW